uniref:Uncharacterized protein n=1 Tax=Oryza glumipatula TaxID=40148 RepID=A0A0D9YDT3_9ORYZ
MAMAMAASLAAHHHLAGGGLLPTPRASGRNGRSGITISMRAQRKQSGDSGSGKGDGGDGRVSGRRRVWRRRKLTKEDDMLRYKLERVPFLEEKVRKVRENGKIICLDINQLMLSQENRFAFTIEDQKTQDGTSFQNGAVLQAVLLRGFGDTSHHFHDQMPPISRSLIFCKKFTRLNVQ